MERIERIPTTLTVRAGTGYLGATVLTDIFFTSDPEGYYAINLALSYAPPENENLRFILMAVIYGGRNNFKSFGFFDEKDSVFSRCAISFSLQPTPGFAFTTACH